MPAHLPPIIALPRAMLPYDVLKVAQRPNACQGPVIAFLRISALECVDLFGDLLGLSGVAVVRLGEVLVMRPDALIHEVSVNTWHILAPATGVGKSSGSASSS
jgi:hypothetical protein